MVQSSSTDSAAVVCFANGSPYEHMAGSLTLRMHRGRHKASVQRVFVYEGEGAKSAAGLELQQIIVLL